MIISFTQGGCPIYTLRLDWTVTLIAPEQSSIIVFSDEKQDLFLASTISQSSINLSEIGPYHLQPDAMIIGRRRFVVAVNHQV